MSSVVSSQASSIRSPDCSSSSSSAQSQKRSSSTRCVAGSSGAVPSAAVGVLPAAGGQGPQLGHLALEVKDRGCLALGLPPARLLKADADEVVTLQRHGRRRPPRER